MEASPAPRPAPRKGRWWIWATAALLLLLTSAAVAVLTFPRWGAERVRVALEERLSKRLNTPVSIDELTLDWDELTMRHIRLDSPIVDLGRVRVELAEHMLWSMGAEAKVMEIDGGRVVGSRAEVEILARAVLEAARAESGPRTGWRAKVKLRPETLRVSRVEVDVEADEGSVRAVRGQLSGEFRPRAESGSIRVQRAELQADFFGPRQFFADAVSTKVAREGGQLVFPMQLQVEGGAFDLTEQISLAAVDGEVTIADEALSEAQVDLTGGFGGAGGADGKKGKQGALWSLSGEGKRDLSAGSITLAMDAFELGRIPQVLERLPMLVGSERGTVGGELSVDFARGKADVDGRLSLDGLNVEHRILARQVVRDIDFGVELRASVDPAAYRVDLEELSIERRGAKLVGAGTVVHTPERETRKYDVAFEVPETDCQVILNAVPPEMVPSLRGLRAKGLYSAKVELKVDFSALDELELNTRVRPRNCKVTDVPPALSLARLRNGFTHRMTMRDGRQRMVKLFAGSSSYAPLTAISPNMVAAVLTTEDAAFWRHGGFLPKQFGEAMKRNLKAGRVRLGASTITMQMVKNVFLSHERTLARKFQELVLTEYVERTLSKERIMELYLNVIEFGPGVYGVRAAADHYFGKHPGELTSLEAAYLALMLPSPVRRHVHYCKGELSPSFTRKLRNIHRLMHSRGHISEAEYMLWKDADLLFDESLPVNKSACLAEIDRLLESTEGQHAITGLLGDAAPTHEDVEQQHAPPREVELPDLEDPAMSDAPGVPAMEQL